MIIEKQVDFMWNDDPDPLNSLLIFQSFSWNFGATADSGTAWANQAGAWDPGAAQQQYWNAATSWQQAAMGGHSAFQSAYQQSAAALQQNHQLSPYDLSASTSGAQLDYSNVVAESSTAYNERAASQSGVSSVASSAAAESDAISALTSLAQNPQGIQTASSSASTIQELESVQAQAASAAVNGHLSAAKDYWGVSSNPSWGGYPAAYGGSCVNGDLAGGLWGYGTPGVTSSIPRPRPQFHLTEIFPDVMKSIDQKLVEMEHQKLTGGYSNDQLRQSALGVFSPPRASGAPSTLNAATYQQMTTAFRHGGYFGQAHSVNSGFPISQQQQAANYFQQNHAMASPGK